VPFRSELVIPTSASNTVLFQIDDPAPLLNSITPSSVTLGTSGTLTLTGTGSCPPLLSYSTAQDSGTCGAGGEVVCNLGNLALRIQRYGKVQHYANYERDRREYTVSSVATILTARTIKRP